MNHRDTAWLHHQLQHILASYGVKGFITVPLLKLICWIVGHKLKAHERLSSEYYGADGWLRSSVTDERVY